jgi:hypothetical protein
LGNARKNPADFFPITMKVIHDFGSCPSGHESARGKVRENFQVRSPKDAPEPPPGMRVDAKIQRLIKNERPA